MCRTSNLAILLSICLISLPASAQVDVQMTLRKDVGTNFVQWSDMTSNDIAEFFNDAHCQCQTPFGVQFRLAVASTSTEELEIWLGDTCDDLTDVNQRNARCTNPHVFTDVGRDLQSAPTLGMNSADLMWPNQACGSDEFSRSVWALINEGQDQTYDYSQTLAVDVDTEPPPLAENVEVVGAEDAVSVSWDLPMSNVNEIRWFQVMCASSLSGDPMFATPVSEPQYETPDIVCPSAQGTPDAGMLPDAAPPDANPTDADPTDADPIDAGTAVVGVGSFDPRYICSNALGGAQRSARIDFSNVTLSAGENIIVWVVSIDEHRNPSAILASPEEGVRPAPVKDAWEVYGENCGQNGEVCARGGFCSVVASGASSAGGAFLLAFFGIALFFVCTRRRRLANVVRRLIPFVLVALWLTGAASASAQPIVYEDEDKSGLRVATSHWNVEFKVGPYLPEIDSQPGVGVVNGNKGPYETTFRGSTVMVNTELDYFLLWPAGQLGVAFAVGYTQDTASAFVQNDDGTTNYNERATGDKTAFHLLPLAVSAVYRFTSLADNTLIPLVPYGKFGLSYYIWWFTKGDGSVASTPELGRARGGTLGVQATLGLSIRADMFDKQAAANLRTEGIEHAGFFIEGTWANVSGLGASEKLYVGDLTWFAGINFEF